MFLYMRRELENVYRNFAFILFIMNYFICCSEKGQQN